jgi:hypothetical protein
MLATRLSIRRAGPEFAEVKKISSGEAFSFKPIYLTFWSVGLPALRKRKTDRLDGRDG